MKLKFRPLGTVIFISLGFLTIVLSIAITSVSITGCAPVTGTNTATNTATVSVPGIYAGGEYLNSAAYWVNGKLTIIGPEGSIIYAMADDGYGNVYAAGGNGISPVNSYLIQPPSDLKKLTSSKFRVNSDSTLESACYWENGIITYLDTNAYESQADSIAVDGANLYFGGSYSAGVNDYPYSCLWDNGALVTIDSAQSSLSVVYSVAVDSLTNVYAAGQFTNINDYECAAYWKNGVLDQIFSNNLNSCIFSIVIHGNTILAGGYYNNSNSVQNACYWTNNVRFHLPMKTVILTLLQSIQSYMTSLIILLQEDIIMTPTRYNVHVTGRTAF